MAAAAFAPLVVFTVILGFIGVRLLRLWLRTRQVPEGCLGFGLLIIVSSLPVTALGRVPATAMEPIGRFCFSLGLGITTIGVALILFFNYWVFRRGAMWSQTLLWSLCLTLGVSVAYICATNFAGESVEAIKRAMRPATLCVMATVFLSFLWAGAEALRSHAAQRRQMALGLGDPVIANRFLLWGLGNLAATALIAVLIGCALEGMTIVHEPLPLAALASAGCLMSASWYLTFFAPERYRHFIRDRAGA